MTALRKQIYLSDAERGRGVVVEVDDGEGTVMVEVPAGSRVGAEIKVRGKSGKMVVEVCERAWGIDGGARRDLAPTAGAAAGDQAFWQRAVEELVEAKRSKREFAGSVYTEKRGDTLVLTGLHRCAVGPIGGVLLDPSWGSLLWHTNHGLLSAVSAFSDADTKSARQANRPLVTICTSALSPAMAANVLFPMGMRPLMVAGAIKGLLALDTRRKGKPLMLGRAVASRIVYPNGLVAPVEHWDASLPRDVYDRAAFAVDKTLGKAESKARRFLKNVYKAAVSGRPPGF